SRVIPARLVARKQTGGRVEVLLLRREAAGDWQALVKPARRLRPGMQLELEVSGVEQTSRAPTPDTRHPTPHVTLGARLEEGVWLVQISDEAAIEQAGRVPLPPYIKRQPEDPGRYQTVYAREPGSAAAPTAGLHFTPELLARLRERGYEIGFVTLHVGLDTFRPVEVEDPADHPIHSEWCELPSETADLINRTRARGGRIVAVGTTSVRVLETAGRQIAPGQPVAPFVGPTRLFIRPGFTYRLVDILITNFHLPRSSLMFLVSAFAGRERILAAYQTAIETGYRFYSFGDAMLIL
ncbi:MAG TPA: tRNA preQ1(34) S-adenosylmethionine ribosyltransferase-isomerase QueA, partial [Dehalococcoidia bacterium]|nr:tRNA preQ1(34) S-adenosylmethionine ribosyltransferase-isomerase QueA [Dehalococcoidia bacterium]